MSRSARLLLAALMVVTVGEAFSLVGRGSLSKSDIGVFYRECVLLNTAAVGDLYARRDAVTDWPISLAPAGLAILQPLASLTPLGASVGWAAINLGLVLLSLVTLRQFLRRANTPRMDVVFPWATMIFLMLSWGSIQVGQFSVLFVACWMLFLTAFANGHYLVASLALAVPSAIKVYPIILLAIPISMAGSVRMGLRQTAFVLLGVAVMALVLPAATYGPARAWDLNLSFWNNVILSQAQVNFMQTLHAGANQSLDTVLLRYLSHDAEFHGLHPNLPHLRLARDVVLQYANLARVFVFLVSAATVGLWRWKRAVLSAHDLLMVAALWSSALYVMLPETKARYAIYAFIGFLPLLEIAATQTEHATDFGARVLRTAIFSCIMLIMVLVPDPLDAYGIGVIGSVGLWLGNVGLMVALEAQDFHPAWVVRELQLHY